MIEIVLSPKTAQIIQKFANTGNTGFNEALKLGIRKTGEIAQRKVRGFAPAKTGNLRRSIDLIHYNYMAIIGTNLEYARIHEFGGTIKPKNAKALRFNVKGKWVTVKQVTIPKFKGRGYFMPAFEEAKQFGRLNIEREINDFFNNLSR